MDGAEVEEHGTNPLEADTDADSLGDGEEVSRFSTSPTRRDTDGDVPDGEEVAARSDSTEETQSSNDGAARQSNTGDGDTGLLETVRSNKLPLLAFVGGLVAAVGLVKAVRFYRRIRSPVIVLLDDDQP